MQRVFISKTLAARLCLFKIWKHTYVYYVKRSISSRCNIGNYYAPYACSVNKRFLSFYRWITKEIPSIWKIKQQKIANKSQWNNLRLNTLQKAVRLKVIAIVDLNPRWLIIFMSLWNIFQKEWFCQRHPKKQCQVSGLTSQAILNTVHLALQRSGKEWIVFMKPFARCWKVLRIL